MLLWAIESRSLWLGKDGCCDYLLLICSCKGLAEEPLRLDFSLRELAEDLSVFMSMDSRIYCIADEPPFLRPPEVLGIIRALFIRDWFVNLSSYIDSDW